jgi:broad-specificity NMP kinase
MKVLITGVAGTGKSTIAKALRQRNLFAVDFSDVKDMCFWQDVKTGEKVEYSPVHSHEWFLTVKRICDINILKQILAQKDDVIVAGVASGNMNEYLPLFDKVILLQCGSQENILRLKSRDNPSGYGKTEIEQKDNLEWQKNFDPQLLSYGAIPVNTEGDLEVVVDKIVTLIDA